jgi:hypothetical protein
VKHTLQLEAQPMSVYTLRHLKILVNPSLDYTVGEASSGCVVNTSVVYSPLVLDTTICELIRVQMALK